MARLGLGEGWACAFANDFDAVKAEVYRTNFPDAKQHLHVGDVWEIKPSDVPTADLAWASSPCQDFSLAGARAGLKGGRSSAFFGFWRLIETMCAQKRAPNCIVIENVVGLLTSHAGRDFQALCQALADQGYYFGALEIDAVKFVPQSRPRVFVIATRNLPHRELTGHCEFQTNGVCMAFARLPAQLRARWQWWKLPSPPVRNSELSSLLDGDEEVVWHTPTQSKAFLALMSEAHRLRANQISADGEVKVGAAFRRMRQEGSEKRQRLEVRFDGIAGCLRVPSGGSSRQALVFAEGSNLKSRLLSGREGARLMGLPESYKLPKSTSAALHVVGDGVVVNVVRFLSENLLTPLVKQD